MYCEFAHWYDKMMHTVDYDGWAAYIERFLDEYRCRSVFECGCGTGNIALRLAKKGFNMIASDVSEDMLMEARRKMMKSGLRFPVVRQDMRHFSAHKPLDAVICACDGVNYLTENPEEFFASAYNALKPGGVLLFDVSSRYKLSKVLNGTSFSDVGEDWAYICENFYEEGANLLRMNLTCFVRSGAAYQRVEEEHIQRGFSAEELKNMLTESGFSNLNCYDCFTLDEPKENSERLQFLAVRP